MSEGIFKKWNELEFRKTVWGDTPGLIQLICDKIQELKCLESKRIWQLPSGQSVHEVKADLEDDLEMIRNP
jgi:hypothetical protein